MVTSSAERVVDSWLFRLLGGGGGGGSGGGDEEEDDDDIVECKDNCVAGTGGEAGVRAGGFTESLLLLLRAGGMSGLNCDAPGKVS